MNNFTHMKDVEIAYMEFKSKYHEIVDIMKSASIPESVLSFAFKAGYLSGVEDDKKDTINSLTKILQS